MKTKHLLLFLLLVALAPQVATAQTNRTVCEDFESVDVSSHIVDLPSGWETDYPNYNSSLANFYAGVCSYNSNNHFSFWPTDGELLAILGSKIVIIPAGPEIKAGTVSYVILPEYYNVSQISFNAWKEHASYGTLELGRITSSDINCSTYQRLQTVNLVSSEYANLSNASFTYNVSLPAATGYRLVFKWTQNTSQDWYGAYIDNLCVTVPKTHIANTVSDTAMTWAQFASNVTNGLTYSGQTIYLDEDITANTMAGSSDAKSFQGQFDGQEHTITVNYTANAIYCAPFRHVKNANFRHLKITGTINNSSYKFTAGFAGYCAGNTQFIDCISDVTINSSVNGDGTHGGFISYIPSGGSTVFQACVFSGKLLGSNTHSCGGFCGYCESQASISFSHCIFEPREVTIGSNNSSTFSRIASGGTFVIGNGNYYTQIFGYEQGQMMRTVTNQPPVNMDIYGQDSPNSTYHPLTQIQYFPTFSAGLKHQGVFHISEGEVAHVILTGGDSYSTSGTVTLNYSGSDNHYYFTMGRQTTLYINAVFNAPSNLQYSNLTATSAKLNWTENGSANRWQICLNNDLNNLITAYSKPYTLNNLAPGTTHTARVRAIRGDYYSSWTSNISFTTTALPGPTNLQCTAAATSATFNWTENASASSWQICINGDETNLIDVNVRPYTHTGLHPETTYTVKIRSKLGEYYSVWSDETSFTTTAIPVASLPYTTNFETDCDWNLVNGDLTNAWTWGTAAHNGNGTRGLYISNDSGTTNAYTRGESAMVYATKNFNFNADAYSFSFDWLAYGESNYDYLRVALVPDTISLEASASILSGFSYNALPSGWITLDGGSKLNLATEWQTTSKEIMISTAGTYKMVFAWRNDGSLGTDPPAAIDNVSIKLVTCFSPADLHHTLITSTTATLAWTENSEATAWQICLNGDMANLIDVTENPYTLTDLTPETAYTAKVRANCGNGDISNWSNEISFDTKQMPVDLPYATDFETSCDWMLVNGNRTNAWVWGEAAHNGEGTHSLYISNDDGETNSYSHLNTMVYATKTFNVEAGIYEFSYDWRAYGESNYDYLRVALVPDTISLEASLSLPSGFSYNTLPSGWIALDGGSELNVATEWQTASNEVLISTSGTYTMVFAWRNDNSDGTNPPAAIDNVSVSRIACLAPTNLVATEVYGYSAKLDWIGYSDSYTVNYRRKAHMTGLYQQFNILDEPEGWTKYVGWVDDVLNGNATLNSTTYGWVLSSSALGEYNMKVNIYGLTCHYWLVTPEVNVSSNNTLEFDLALTDNINSNPIEDPTAQADDRFVVLIYTDGTWTILREWNNTGSDYVYNTIATTGEHVSVNLSTYVGKTVKIAFYGESTINGGNNDLHIDNVGIGIPVPVGEWQQVTVDEASVWLAGLTPEASYEAKVQGNCGDDGLSQETDLISINTIGVCPVPTALTVVDNLTTQTTADLQWNGSVDVQSYTVMYRTVEGINRPIFREGFEDGLGDWTLLDCNNNTGISNNNPHIGQNLFRFVYNTTPPQYLISPTLSGVAEGMRLEFYYKNGIATYSETFQIGFSSTDNATESFTFGNEITVSDVQWHLYSEPIPAGTKYICWKYNSNDKFHLYLDDIAVGWHSTAGDWQTVTLAGGTNPMSTTLTGLIPGAIHEAQVKSDCSDPEEWSHAILFITEAAPAPPTDLQCTNVTSTSAHLEWNVDTPMESFTVRYREPETTVVAFSEGFENGIGDWTVIDGYQYTQVYQNSEFAHTSTGVFNFFYHMTTEHKPQYLISPELTGLAEGMTLDFYYKSGDAIHRETFYVGFSSTDNATDSFSFGFPIQTVSGQWEHYNVGVPAGTKYICLKYTSDEFRLFIDDITIGMTIPSGDWQTVTTTDTYVTLTGLIPETTYEAQVKGDCEYCDWSVATTFTTLEDLPATIPYSTDFEDGCDWMLVNGDRPNAWVWGEAAHNGEGTHSLYISNDDGTSNAYTFNEAASMVYATKTFQFESGLYAFNYDWRANGDGAQDFLRVFLVPDTVVLEAGTSIPNNCFYGFANALPEGWVVLDEGLPLRESTEWQTLNKEVLVPTAGLYNMVFAWYNNEWNGTNPPAAIDNVSITPLSCAQPTGLICSATTATTATLSWTENYEATAWQVCLNDDETNLIDVTENPCTVVGLTPETVYTAKVRAHCGENDFSAWSNLVSFEATDKILIGSGTATNSYVPFFIHSYSQTQQIYTVDELGDAGTIVSIDYFKVGNTVCERNLDIYMVHTDAYAFQTPPNLAWIPVTTADLVFSGTVDFVDDWWTTITLDTPFPYDGLHNVAILVDDNTGGTYNGDAYFLSFTTSEYQAVFYLGSGNVDPLTNTSWTSPQKAKNQIRVLKVPQTTVTQTIELSEGWNWFSTFIAADDPIELLDMIKEGLGDNALQIQASNGAVTEFDGEEWFGDLDEEGIFNEQTYLIQTSAACTILLEGTPAVVDEYEITINPGWNWIGFPSAAPIDVIDALANFEAEEGDQIQCNDATSTEFDGEEWFGDLETFTPGLGYMYYSSSPDTKILIFLTGTKAKEMTRRDSLKEPSTSQPFGLSTSGK